MNYKKEYKKLKEKEMKRQAVIQIVQALGLTVMYVGIFVYWIIK